jgi:hypothetical protein
MCEGGGAISAHAKQSLTIVQPTAHITIQITMHMLKTMPFKQSMKSMVSGPNICASNSFSIVLKPKQ